MPEPAQSTQSNGSAGAAPAGRTAITDQAGPKPEDLAHLSRRSDAVHRLKAQLDAVPDIRQQRVESLRQALGDGSFEVSPEHIAEAMLAGEDWNRGDDTLLPS
jgi:negative regulator of flagellin synthesis FlgM